MGALGWNDLTVDSAGREGRRQEGQGRSVAHLQGLYGVVVALALSIAVERVLPASGRDVLHLPLLLASALLATLVPFYHGALRHLDEQYVVAEASPPREWALLVDFPLLFLESGLFLAMAVAVARPRLFLAVFFILLAVDVVWAWLTTMILAASPPGESRRGLRAQNTWSVVNLLACGGLGLLGVLSLSDRIPTGSLWWAIMGVAVARSALDYALTWRFYVATEES
jgi:hypothetical protein